MQPPNQGFNSCNYGDYLSELRDVSTGKRVIAHCLAPDGSELFDAAILERSLRNSQRVGQALIHCEAHNWSKQQRNGLKGAVRQCVNAYCENVRKERLKDFQDFWSQNVDYPGQFRGVYRNRISWIGNTPYPPDDYLASGTDSMRQLKINNVLEKYLDLLVEWCMCCFSHRKNDWTYLAVSDSIRLDLNATYEPVFVPPDKVKQGPTQEEIADKAERKRRSKTRRQINRLVKKGAITGLALEQLEEQELMKGLE